MKNTEAIERMLLDRSKNPALDRRRMESDSWEREMNPFQGDDYRDEQYQYNFDDNRLAPIVFKENMEALGKRVWDTSILMAKFFERTLRKPVNVLELGSGCGLVGCVLASLGSSVTFTDRRVIVPHLKSNVENACKNVRSTVNVIELDWNTRDLPETVALREFDVVIGSDITVFTKDMPALFQVVRRVCTKETIFYLGTVIGREGNEQFLSLCKEEFTISMVDTSNNTLREWSSNRIVLYKLQKF